jgi:hypothetical protein
VLLILAFALLFVPGAATNLLPIIGLLAPIVLLHELGHSLVAQHYGIRVLDITFWPLGGMARMSEIPEDSRIEGRIAIAGPLVNFALFVVALPLAFVPGSIGWLAVRFCAFNLVLGVFVQLAPGLPDGRRARVARVARARRQLVARDGARGARRTRGRGDDDRRVLLPRPDARAHRFLRLVDGQPGALRGALAPPRRAPMVVRTLARVLAGRGEDARERSAHGTC